MCGGRTVRVLLQEALNRQSRPSAEQLGLSMDPFTDSMSDLDTLDLRLEYVAAMMKGVSTQQQHLLVVLDTVCMRDSRLPLRTCQCDVMMS